MSTDQPQGFANNWDYLKTELRWLDQVLMLAVSRQRKEGQEVERVSQNRADRVTSHWWKGLVSMEDDIFYDEHRTPGSAKVSYQQQLESRVQLSHRQGVRLALPNLRDRLGLSLFEKNVVLMSLAPEMNRRYARLYRYLQGEDAACKTDLPTVDLVLRLLCRNDAEWRAARTRLTTASPLLRHDLLHISGSADTFLNRPLQLTEPLIRYLLAEQPTDQSLEILLQESRPATHPTLLEQTVDGVDWSALVVPEPLRQALQYMVQRVEGYTQAEERWGFDGSNAAVYQPGAMALLVGAPGTGKSLAAGAIAHQLDTPLYTIDLAEVEPGRYLQVLEEIQTQDPTVLLIQSAQCWLGRSTTLSAPVIQQFFKQRRSLPGVTLLSVERPGAVQMQWQRQVDQVLSFALPEMADRLELWSKAFAPSVPLAKNLEWQRLATLPLSGGDIGAIAHESVLYAASQKALKVEMGHIVQVLSQRGLTLKAGSLIRVRRRSEEIASVEETEKITEKIESVPSTPAKSARSKSAQAKTTKTKAKTKESETAASLPKKSRKSTPPKSQDILSDVPLTPQKPGISEPTSVKKTRSKK